MHVHDRLPGLSADIHSDVVTRWPQGAVDPLPRGSDQADDVADLHLREIEDVSNVSSRDDQAVARRDRVGVKNHESVDVCLNDPVGSHPAKRAGIRF